MVKISNFSSGLVLTVFLMIILDANINAQSYYSYVTDRKFLNPYEIIGYTFCPEFIGFEDGDKSKLEPGEICLNISRNYLLIKGEPIGGAFSINAIKAEKYGYKMELMDANDPSKQGSLKIYLNHDYQVDALVLRQSKESDQLVFFQAKMPDKTAVRELEYFTDRNEIQLHQLDSIWGKTIRPFHRLEGGRQVRLNYKDSLEVRFTKTVKGEGKKEKTYYHIETRAFQKDNEDGYTEVTEVFEVKKYRLLTSQVETDAEQRYYVEMTSKDAPGGVVGLYLNQAKGISMIEIGDTRLLMRGY